LIRYKNLNFLFPLTAALFTFSNNTNDAWNYIYHVENCSPFYYILKITDTLNWAPMSWLQVYRLVIISNINLPKRITSPIITLAILLNLTYYFCYFNNLNNYKKDRNNDGCIVSNPSLWLKRVMISDIFDSIFSMALICIIVFKSIMYLKELNTKNEKLNNLVGQGTIELYIIALVKIILYPFIIKYCNMLEFDFFFFFFGFFFFFFYFFFFFFLFFFFFIFFFF